LESATVTLARACVVVTYPTQVLWCPPSTRPASRRRWRCGSP